MNSIVLVALLFTSLLIAQPKTKKEIIIEVPVVAGKWQHIFDPNDTRSDIDTTWYTNDHCFAKGPDGRWHAYGIIGHKPINPWIGETRFFHISADKMSQASWEDHDLYCSLRMDHSLKL